ncbi:hypothetical protein [Paenibacillus sp. 1P07SE]|uniref:hypothetical protein n=1 Tax=Paenibacillus sp. 1P07SE TaxID=3132209 RepID=UPI0039A5A627
MAVKWLGILSLSVMLGVTGCSSAAKPMPHQRVEATGSLAFSYETFGSLAEHSNLVVEVEIHGVSHVEVATDSTYYEAEIIDVLLTHDDAPVGDRILVKSHGIAERGGASGDIIVSSMDTLMHADEQYILFLSSHDTIEDAYWLTGGYQSVYKLVEQRVHSLDGDASKSIYAKDEPEVAFKEKLRMELEGDTVQ